MLCGEQGYVGESMIGEDDVVFDVWVDVGGVSAVGEEDVNGCGGEILSAWEMCGRWWSDWNKS